MEKINHPEHYNKGKIEVIDIIETWNLDFSMGSAIKYILRSPYKGTFEDDIKKAIWFLNRKIENE